MNKKTFIIVSITMFVLLATTITLFVIFNPFKDETKEKYSEEFLKYDAMFELELKNNEYYIHELKNTKLSNVEIPDSIDNIPVTKLVDVTEDFSSYRNVSKIKIGKNIKYIGTRNVDTGLGYKVLANATGLSTIEVDSENSVYASFDGILYSKDFKTLIKYPNSKAFTQASLEVEIDTRVEIIYDYAFYLNTNISSLVCNPNLKEIGTFAFGGASNLSHITFNENLKEIGSNAFERCSTLATVSLPASLMYLRNNAFISCVVLSDVTILNPTIELGNNIFSATKKEIIFRIKEELVPIFTRENENNQLDDMGLTSSRQIKLYIID